ncbi:MAG: hypothetical protein EXR95_04020 [Gemmatimonadetes bacterium]|nr:hypothetical protein [Gemmatimonadota bacterium]
MMRRLGLGAALVLALVALARPAAAQSVLAAGGLGIPVEPVDGRGRGMGSVGPGLFGTAVIPGDPAAALDLLVPTLTFSMQSSWLTVDQSGERSNQSAIRFPAIGVAYPVRDWGTLTATYGGFLDQRWTFERDRQLDLGAGSRTAVTDAFVSDGGISAVRLGFAHRVSRSLGLGASVGGYTGNVLRRFSRTFDSLGVNVPIEPFQTGGRWGYSGMLADLGVVLEVPAVARAAATLSWSSDLSAQPDSTTAGAKKSYDLPLQLRAGVTGQLAPGLSASLSGGYADWTGVGDDLARTTSAGATTSLGAGIEWDRATLFGRGLPIRLGWHRTELPFQFNGDDPVESVLAGGIGLLLARTGTVPLARIDFAVERGRRVGGSLGEDLWRSTVTFRAAGF